jgi:hypothetical protein
MQLQPHDDSCLDLLSAGSLSAEETGEPNTHLGALLPAVLAESQRHRFKSNCATEQLKPCFFHLWNGHNHTSIASYAKRLEISYFYITGQDESET